MNAEQMTLAVAARRKLSEVVSSGKNKGILENIKGAQCYHFHGQMLPKWTDMLSVTLYHKISLRVTFFSSSNTAALYV